MPAITIDTTIVNTLIELDSTSATKTTTIWSEYSEAASTTKGKINLFKHLESMDGVTKKRGVFYGLKLTSGAGVHTTRVAKKQSLDSELIESLKKSLEIERQRSDMYKKQSEELKKHYEEKIKMIENNCDEKLKMMEEHNDKNIKTITELYEVKLKNVEEHYEEQINEFSLETENYDPSINSDSDSEDEWDNEDFAETDSEEEDEFKQTVLNFLKKKELDLNSENGICAFNHILSFVAEKKFSPEFLADMKEELLNLLLEDAYADYELWLEMQEEKYSEEEAQLQARLQAEYEEARQRREDEIEQRRIANKQVEVEPRRLTEEELYQIRLAREQEELARQQEENDEGMSDFGL